MSKPSRRPRREEWKQARKDRKREWKELRRQQAMEGLKPLEQKALPNQKSDYRTGTEEQEARQTVGVFEPPNIRRQRSGVLCVRT